VRNIRFEFGLKGYPMADSVKKQKVDVKGKVVNIRIDMDDQFYIWKSGHSIL